MPLKHSTPNNENVTFSARNEPNKCQLDLQERECRSMCPVGPFAYYTRTVQRHIYTPFFRQLSFQKLDISGLTRVFAEIRKNVECAIWIDRRGTALTFEFDK